MSVRSVKLTRVHLSSTSKADTNCNSIISVRFEFELESCFASLYTFLVLRDGFLFRRVAVWAPQVFLIVYQAVNQTSTKQFRRRIDSIAGARRSDFVQQSVENEQLQIGQRL